jgi:hypothetical protein
MKTIKIGDMVKVKKTGEELQTIRNPDQHIPQLTSINKLPDLTRWECSDGKTYKVSELEIIDT